MALNRQRLVAPARPRQGKVWGNGYWILGNNGVILGHEVSPGTLFIPCQAPCAMPVFGLEGKLCRA